MPRCPHPSYIYPTLQDQTIHGCIHSVLYRIQLGHPNTYPLAESTLFSRSFYVQCPRIFFPSLCSLNTGLRLAQASWLRAKRWNKRRWNIHDYFFFFFKMTTHEFFSLASSSRPAFGALSISPSRVPSCRFFASNSSLFQQRAEGRNVLRSTRQGWATLLQMAAANGGTVVFVLRRFLPVLAPSLPVMVCLVHPLFACVPLFIQVRKHPILRPSVHLVYWGVRIKLT